MASNYFDKYDPQPDAAPLPPGANYFDKYDPPPIKDTSARSPALPASQDTWARQAGLIGRNAITTVAALPMLGMNAGVGARNLIGDALNKWQGKPATPDYKMPSAMLEQSLDDMGFPKPVTTAEKLGGVGQQMIMGGAIPNPTSGINVPANFMTPAETQKAMGKALLARAQDAGYVIPPSMEEPTVTNKVVETIAGKRAVEAGASAKNEAVTDALVKTSLGLKPDEPVGPATFAALRKEASQDYETVRGAGRIITDDKFASDLQKSVSRFRGVAKDFPEMAENPLDEVIQNVKKPSFDAGSGIDMTQILRDRADAAYAKGEKSVGAGYRQISKAIEDQIQRHLENQGEDASGILGAFRSARTRIAQTYSAEDAFNPATFHFNAATLGKAFKNDEPLTGGLRTVGEFAAAYPKAVAPVTSSPVNHLDSSVPLLGALLGHTPMEKAIGLAWPAGRSIAKHVALGPIQEALAKQPQSQQALARGLMAFGPLANRVSSE